MYNETITGRERHTKRILAAILALMLALIPACLAEQACTIHFTAGEAPAASADIETSCIEIDGVRYVPLDAIADGLGYSCSVDVVEDSESPMVGEWVKDDGSGTYIRFNADGTGESGGTAANMLTIEFNWNATQTGATMHYMLNGAQQTNDYVYEIRDDGSERVYFAKNPDYYFVRPQAAGSEPEADAGSAITGKWTCNHPNVNSCLDFSEDGTCKLNFGDAVYRLDWSMENNTLELTQGDATPLKAIYDPEQDTIKLYISGPAGDSITYTR